MLSDKSTVCPNNLLDIAHQKKGIKVAIANAGKTLPMISVMDAVKEKLIVPVLIGNESEIKKTADEIKFDISEYEIIDEPVENNTMHILRNVIDFCHRINIPKPKISILSATEEVLDSMQSSLDAKEITNLAEKEGFNADIFGPLAFDNSISKKSAGIKGIKNIVAGDADVLLVPNVETGNALVKMMIYFMGACAAGVVVGGKVPVVITSRSDDATARLASIAAAVVALD